MLFQIDAHHIDHYQIVYSIVLHVYVHTHDHEYIRKHYTAYRLVSVL